MRETVATDTPARAATSRTVARRPVPARILTASGGGCTPLHPRGSMDAFRPRRASLRACSTTDTMEARPSATAAPTEGVIMASSIARVTTITARSDVSFEDAIQAGVGRAAQTLRNVSGAWVKEQKVEVSDGAITAYQVVLEVTFVLDD